MTTEDLRESYPYISFREKISKRSLLELILKCRLRKTLMVFVGRGRSCSGDLARSRQFGDLSASNLGKYAAKIEAIRLQAKRNLESAKILLEVMLAGNVK